MLSGHLRTLERTHQVLRQPYRVEPAVHAASPPVHAASLRPLTRVKISGTLDLPGDIRDEMVEHARTDVPYENYGLLA